VDTARRLATARTAPYVTRMAKPLPLPPLPAFVSGDEDAVSLKSLELTLDHTVFVAGGLLTRNWGRLKHGEWLPWLKKGFGRSETTARRYMYHYETCLAADPPQLLPYHPGIDERSSTVEDLVPNVEFYTPAIFVEAARQILGGIDLDPASNAEANEKVIRAKKIFTKDDDGLADHNEWHGRVFCNPPYQGLTPKFARKLLAEYQAGRTKAAILLVTNQATRAEWFQDLLPGNPICLVAVPMKWWGPDGEASAGPWGSVFIYLGPDYDDFMDEFSRFGSVGMLNGQRPDEDS